VRWRERKLRRELPHLTDVDAPLVTACAREQTISADLWADLHSRGAFNEAGEPRTALDFYRRHQAAAVAYYRELRALNDARASGRADPVAALAEQGRRLRLAREAEEPRID
jgi:hypothetical protein